MHLYLVVFSLLAWACASIGLNYAESNNTTDYLITDSRNSSNSGYVMESEEETGEVSETTIGSREEFCFVMEIAPEDCSCEKSEQVCIFPFEEEEEKIFVSWRPGDIAVATITTISALIGVLGNTIVIVVNVNRNKILKESKIIVVYLALSDGLSAVVNFFATVHLFWSPKWVFGPIFCSVLLGGMTATSCLSVGYITLISLERFLGIIYPFKTALRGRRMVHLSALINLAIVLVTCAPMLVNHRIDEFGVCSISFKTEDLVYYRWFFLIFYLLIPICTVSGFYMKIIFFLVRQTKMNMSLSREDIKRKRQKENRRTVKILMPVLVAFVACVLMTFLINLYLAYKSENISLNLYRILTLLRNFTFPFHSCVNPIIYTAVDGEFRNDMLNLFRSKSTEMIKKRKTIETDLTAISQM